MKSPLRKSVAQATLTFFALVAFVPLGSESPDLTNMSILLKRNDSDIRAIDTSLSNMPMQGKPDALSDKLQNRIKEQYRKAVHDDFYARMWFMQGNYSRTYRRLRASRKELKEAYRRVLINYIDDTYALLEGIAPKTVRTRDKQAQHLLRLGYRDLESSRRFYMRGYNIRPSLYSRKIDQYREAIKRVRRSRRYALLALIESRLPHSEKPQFQVVTLDDVKNRAYNLRSQQSSYKKTYNSLINLMGRDMIGRTVKRMLARQSSLAGQPRMVELKILNIHQDNYNRLITERRSAWNEIMKAMSSMGFDPNKPLPSRNRRNRNEIPRSKSDPPSDKLVPATKTP